MQLTWQGKAGLSQAGSCPSNAFQTKYAEILSHCATPSHWSTCDTIEAAIDDGHLYLTYIVPKCRSLNIDPLAAYWMVCWDVYSSHRDAALLARLKAKYPRLLISFVPASCTSELQALDVGFNGPFKGWITHFANKWLAADIRRQLEADPDPTRIRLGMKKSDLVEPFCGWIADATAVMKTKPALILRCWEKTGVLVACVGVRDR